VQDDDWVAVARSYSVADKRDEFAISLGGDRGQGPVDVRSTSDRVEILCTAVKDAKCHFQTHALRYYLCVELRGPLQQLLDGCRCSATHNDENFFEWL
jgi:hypothetical protein